MDCIVHGVIKSWTQLSNFHFHSASCLQFYIFCIPLAIFINYKSLTRCSTLYGYHVHESLQQPYDIGMTTSILQIRYSRDSPRLRAVFECLIPQVFTMRYSPSVFCQVYILLKLFEKSQGLFKIKNNFYSNVLIL